MGPGHIALRKGRHSIAGQIYFITFTTAGRQPHFTVPTIAMDAARLLADTSAWHGSRLLAWVLMPDHWHGLVELGEGTTLPVCVGGCKGLVARQLRQRHPELGPVWAAGYHDRALRKNDDVLAAARYLVMNPVRARLVERVAQYPYWNAAWM